MLSHGTETGSGGPLTRLAHGVAALTGHTAPREEALELAAGATWSAPEPRGCTVRCERGSVWITVEGDPEDHVLTSPGAFSSPAHGRFALMALEPSRVVVEPQR